jgi:LemA protein
LFTANFFKQEGKMGTGATVLIVILTIILFGIFFFVAIYNKLIQLKNRFKNAFSQIDVQLKRRYDLIPNLVEIAKGYMKHEREVLEAVIKARNQASSAMEKASADPGNSEALQGLIGAESTLTGTLGRLFALVEAYPDLKANQNMMQLSEELTTTENKVSFARQAFNDAVMAYNTAREVFPNNIVANMFAFREAQLFEIKVEAEKEAPKVSF